jgi:DNA-binding transcriptional regulator YiaG
VEITAENDVVRLARVRELVESGRARKIRRRRQISQGEFARALDVSPSQLSRWEAGERLPRGDAALRYLDLLEQLEAL